MSWCHMHAKHPMILCLSSPHNISVREQPLFDLHWDKGWGRDIYLSPPYTSTHPIPIPPTPARTPSPLHQHAPPFLISMERISNAQSILYIGYTPFTCMP